MANQPTKKINVNIHLNCELTSEIVDSEKPDTVTAQDILMGTVTTGARVAIIGGGLVGTETANHLANHGKNVTIIEMMPEIAVDEPFSVREFLLKDLANKGVRILTNFRLQKITAEGLVAAEFDCEENLGKFDTIVIAVGVKAVNELTHELVGKVNEIITIGDATTVRKALEAIHEGFNTGIAI